MPTAAVMAVAVAALATGPVAAQNLVDAEGPEPRVNYDAAFSVTSASGDWSSRGHHSAVFCHASCMLNPAGSTRCGLLVMMHGVYSNPDDQIYLTLGYNQNDGFRADRPLCVAFPKAASDGWDYDVAPATDNDVAFLSRLIDFMLGEYDIHPDRVYLGGFSSGSIMSLTAAASHTTGHKIAGIVSYGGVNKGEPCHAAGKFNHHVMHTHGTHDKIVPFGGQIYDGPYKVCGARRFITNVATARGYEVGNAEAQCSRDCDRFLQCFEDASIQGGVDGGNPWYFGGCDFSTGTISAARWPTSGLYGGALPVAMSCGISTAEVNACKACFPDSPCAASANGPQDDGYASSPATQRTVSFSSRGTTLVHEYTTAEGDDSCGAARLYTMVGHNHDFPDVRRSGDHAGAVEWWFEANDFMWNHPKNHAAWCYGGGVGAGPTAGICLDDPSPIIWAHQGTDYSCSSPITLQYRCNTGLDHDAEIHNYCPVSCGDCIESSTPQPTEPTAPSPPTPTPTLSPLSPSPPPTSEPHTGVCDAPDVFHPTNHAGYTCSPDFELDSNFGGTASGCQADGGSWDAYECSAVEVHLAELGTDYEHYAVMRATWSAQCCSPSPPPTSEPHTGVCDAPDVFHPTNHAGYTCSPDFELDSNFGGTASGCQADGGSWDAYECSTVEVHLAELGTDYEHYAEMRATWSAQCCSPQTSSVPSTSTPSTSPPSTGSPSVQAIATSAPISSAPAVSPTTPSPATDAPTSSAPVDAPISSAPAVSPTIPSPATDTPASSAPVDAPISSAPAVSPTTPSPATVSPATSAPTAGTLVASVTIMSVTFPGNIATLSLDDEQSIIDAVIARLEALFGTGSVLGCILQAGSINAITTLASQTPASITAASDAITAVPINITMPSTGMTLTSTAVAMVAPRSPTEAPTTAPNSNPNLDSGAESSDSSDSSSPGAVVAGVTICVLIVLVALVGFFVSQKRKKAKNRATRAVPATENPVYTYQTEVLPGETVSGAQVPQEVDASKPILGRRSSFV